MPSYDVVERDWDIKVNANESNMNLPPIIEDRLMARLASVAFNRYPNEQVELLAEQIADNFRLDKENILIANGSSEILEKLFFAFGGRGRKIVYPQPSFSMYKIYAKFSASIGVPVDLNDDYTFNASDFVNAVKENKASLAVICSPNNPTGIVTYRRKKGNCLHKNAQCNNFTINCQSVNAKIRCLSIDSMRKMWFNYNSKFLFSRRLYHGSSSNGLRDGVRPRTRTYDRSGIQTTGAQH